MEQALAEAQYSQFGLAVWQKGRQALPLALRSKLVAQVLQTVVELQRSQFWMEHMSAEHPVVALANPRLQMLQVLAPDWQKRQFLSVQVS
jgi:hypothetical protein